MRPTEQIDDPKWVDIFDRDKKIKDLEYELAAIKRAVPLSELPGAPPQKPEGPPLRDVQEGRCPKAAVIEEQLSVLDNQTVEMVTKIFKDIAGRGCSFVPLVFIRDNDYLFRLVSYVENNHVGFISERFDSIDVLGRRRGNKELHEIISFKGKRTNTKGVPWR